MDTALMILAMIATGSTLIMFLVEEVYLAVIFGTIGMVTCFATAGYWLSAQTNIPGAAWVFGGLDWSMLYGLSPWVRCRCIQRLDER